MDHPVAAAATLFVYSPDDRTMFLEARLQVDEPQKQPPLQLSITHGKIVHAASIDTQTTGKNGIIVASAPLLLARGINTIHFALGGSATHPPPFFVQSVHVAQRVCNGGNLLVCLTLCAITGASILAAQALGANGLNLFCAAPLLGFFLLTASATLLSPFHLLTGGRWAAVLLTGSMVLATAAAWRLRQSPAPKPEPKNTLQPLEAGVLLVLVCPVFLMAILSPITHWDDLMYHGPRTAYWMENASAFPFPSHDDRLAVFPIGGDLLFACGTILSGSELPGKFLVCLALPLTLFALLALLKNAGVRAPVALGATVLFATTPIVMANAVGIKPDLWLVLFGVVTLHWVLVARRGNSGLPWANAACWAVAGAGAAFGIKWTAAPLLLLAPFALLRPGWRQNSAARLLPAAGVFVLALALGGAGPTLLYNLATSQHPFGSAALRRWHQPDPGWQRVAVQFKRLPFILCALPFVPSEAIRQAMEHWETSVADAIGATEPLWRENDAIWPGRFSPHVKRVDDGFSLSWIFVGLGATAGLYALRRREDPEKGRTFLLLFGLALSFVLAVVTQTRWQAAAGLPDRFLLPGLAFGLITAAGPLDRLLARHRTGTIVLGGLLALHAVPYGLSVGTPFRFGAENGWQAPVAPETTSELDGISRLLPPGRTILLLAGQGCLDYPLFLAREGFANRVLPWGKAAYDPAAFDRALHRPGVDTVMLVSPDAINLIWDPPLDARPFVQEMNARADFTRLPGTGGLVVYARKTMPPHPPGS